MSNKTLLNDQIEKMKKKISIFNTTSLIIYILVLLSASFVIGLRRREVHRGNKAACSDRIRAYRYPFGHFRLKYNTIADGQGFTVYRGVGPQYGCADYRGGPPY